MFTYATTWFARTHTHTIYATTRRRRTMHMHVARHDTALAVSSGVYTHVTYPGAPEMDACVRASYSLAFITQNICPRAGVYIQYWGVKYIAYHVHVHVIGMDV